MTQARFASETRELRDSLGRCSLVPSVTRTPMPSAFSMRELTTEKIS
jgi:hypothetical protein